MKLTLLEQLVDILFEANEELQKEILKAAKKGSNMPISMRTVPRSSDFSLIADGSNRGSEAADDHEVELMFRSVVDELGKKYQIERIFDRVHEKPTGLVFSSKNAKGVVHPILRVFFQKKPVIRGKLDGDRMSSYDQTKTTARKTKAGNDRAGEKNEKMFVKLIKQKIDEAGGVLKLVEFDGYTNDRKFTCRDIVEARWVGGKNHKTDVELISEDGEVYNLSLKQRDYLEISAGNEYFHKHEDRIFGYLQYAVDHEMVEFQDDGNLSKNRAFEVAVEMSRKEAATAYFGHEHDKVDTVIIETFVVSDFELNNEGKLHIRCDYVLNTAEDIHKRIWPFISINSDFARDETKNPMVLGNTYVSIVPRYRLQTHVRKSSGHPKTIILDR